MSKEQKKSINYTEIWVIVYFKQLLFHVLISFMPLENRRGEISSASI